MFLALARWFQQQDRASSPAQLEKSASKVFELHPLLLARAIEEGYLARDLSSPRGPFPSPALPLPVLQTDLSSGLESVLKNVPDDIYPLGGGGQPFVWHHLVYAFLLEQTRAFEIFERVLFEYLHGEVLEVPSEAGQVWLRTTEDLLYRDAPSFQIYTLTSWIRPDIRASRRNAYWRLFGIDLDHGAAADRSYPYHKAPARRRGFDSPDVPPAGSLRGRRVFGWLRGRPQPFRQPAARFSQSPMTLPAGSAS